MREITLAPPLSEGLGEVRAGESEVGCEVCKHIPLHPSRGFAIGGGIAYKWRRATTPLADVAVDR
jgi:hypothetical protein